MKKVKILILINGSSLGGTERSAIITYKYLNREKFIPVFGMLQKPDARFIERLEGVKPETINVNELIDYIKINKIDILYSFFKPTEQAIKEIIPHTKLLQSVVFTEHYNPLNNANLMISKTEHLKAKIYNGGKIKNDYVLYFPIDVKKWEELSRENTPFIKKDDRIVLGRIGRSEPSKWHYLILATLHYFRKKDGFKKYRFVFAGMPKLYRKYIEIFFKKYVKNNSIILLPELVNDKEVSKFYKSLDVFLQTAWIGESFGCVITEAYCFDAAVVSDWKRFTKDGKTADLMKYDSQLEMVDYKNGGTYSNYPSLTYNWIESQNKNTLKKMGKYGHNKVKNLYLAEKIIRNLENLILGEILEKNKEKYNKFYPKRKEVDEFLQVYNKNFRIIDKLKKEVPLTQKISYSIKERIWRLIEYKYLFIRKILKKLNYDLEKRN